MDIESLAEDVQRLRDIEELKQLKTDFCRYVDGLNHQDWLSLFTENARVITGAYPREREVYEGHNELPDLLRDIDAQNRQLMKHNAFNPTFEFEGETASGRWNTLVVIVFSDGTISWLQGEYDEEYRRVNDQWRYHSIDIIVQYQMDFNGTWKRIKP